MSLTPVPQSAVVPRFGNVIGENAYRILKNGAFANGNNVVTDVFTDSNGKNNTKSGGTAVFDTDHFTNSSSQGTQNGSTDTTTRSALGNSYVLVHTYTSVNARLYSLDADIRVNDNSLTAHIYFKFNYADATTANSSTGSKVGSSFGTVTCTNPNPTKLIDSIEVYIKNNHSSYTAYETNIKQYLAVIGTDETVICGSNTKTLDGSETKFALFGDVEVPAGCGVTYNISDGISSITDQQLGETVDISSLGAGTCEITLNLTSDGLDIPKVYGYSGVFVEG